uniref:Uncharacterized protein n=1 Tax=Panagrolaimus sp. JU765 TaxID=591449 RepID=A0AC34QE66_9BILA
MSDSKNVERILDVMMQQQQQMQQLINVQNKTLELLMNELMGRKTKTAQSDSVESVEEDDRSTQISNSFKKQDSKKKPSRPCRNCNGMHWDNECPTQRDGKYKK